MNNIVLSRITAVWVGLVCFIMIGSPHVSTSTFYRFGPNENLVILGGIRVDTWGKYLLVVLYSMINTCIRCVKGNILTPWLMLNIQDESKPLTGVNPFHAYEMTLVTNLYTWVDWWISVNLLMSQIDLIIIEIIFDFVTLYYITRRYLTLPGRQVLRDDTPIL